LIWPALRDSRPTFDAKVFPTMSSDKRLIYFMVVSCLVVFSLQYLMLRAGLIKPEPEPPVVAKDNLGLDRAKAKKAPDDLPDNVFAPEVADAPAARKPEVNETNPADLVLGSDVDESPSAYHLRLQLDQTGAAVAVATSARYDAEFDPKVPVVPGRRPRLKLIEQPVGAKSPGSLSMTVISDAKAPRLPIGDNEDINVEPPRVESDLDLKLWEVVRAKDGAPAVKLITRIDPATNKPVEGQEISFRITAKDPGVTITKTYRLWKGEDAFDVDLAFSSPAKETKFTYRLFGPHGIPIEGAWYTSTFREVFFGQAKDGKTELSKPITSTDIVKAQGDPTANRFSTLPLTFAGVEDQYFATFVEPWPIPRSQNDRIEKEAGPFVFAENLKEPQFSDVGVELVSKPIQVGPNLGEIVHKYKVFAGPKLAAQLTPFEAEELASYRKQWIPIPGASQLARYVISPLLDKIYSLTQAVAHVFGWKNGNFGIAIVLLTMTVRLIMFPIGRKQAMMAKKMQDLQPYLVEIKEKYKDDKEATTRETMALWKRHKVNPAAGCLPALIQMPIFVGLWQSLNNSVALRHSSFVYIRDLAAPDMMFHLPFTLPILNADYFNLLPFLVVALMLVQTKLFAPPPTTPEAEMNQKMMKYMMIFMAFMFYKVPSGLGLYFITSSLWQIGERLLLPKVVAKQPKEVDHGEELGGDRKGPGPNGKGPGGPGPNGNGNGGAKGWLSKKLEKLLEDAAKDTTIRNADAGGAARERNREREREGDRDRTRPKPRPGKRR
jgi:YidC/Oxa1 family membrane protein insertase